MLLHAVVPPEDPGVLTGRQIRMARSMLRMTARELATRARTSPTSIARAEATDGIPAVQARTLHRIQAALEQAGAEFGRDGVTVRLRREP